ncbi:hypothetical protein F5Y06DRAFT_254657 [Hypoxylon sp. FL0890]|nr:hypothetical protein F5Y06DRAFT_254657 [Hypoxylon sp. FL0890]
MFGPLAFQPGKNWHYGTGVDWAGKLVERLSGINLEEHMRSNVLGPLNAHLLSFLPDSNPGG